MDTARMQSRVLRKTVRRHATPGQEGLTAADSWLSSHHGPKTISEAIQERGQDSNELSFSRRLWTANIILRAVSLVSAFIVGMIGFAMLNGHPYYFQRVDFVWVIVPGCVISLWDMAEFIIVYRRGRGLPGKVHLVADAIFSLSAVAAIILTWVANRYGINGTFWYALIPGVEEFALLMVVTVFLALIMVVHSSCFFILCCTGGKRIPYQKPDYTPRLMYLPTGEPVVVLARPLPAQATIQPRRQNPPVVDIYDLADMDGPRVASPRQEQSSTVSGPQPGPSSPTPPQYGLPQHDQAIGSSPTGTHYATPWPSNYEPDAAERARAARGEAQAQWMTLATSNIRPEKGN